jgi:hypothetical protein
LFILHHLIGSLLVCCLCLGQFRLVNLTNQIVMHWFCNDNGNFKVNLLSRMYVADIIVHRYFSNASTHLTNLISFYCVWLRNGHTILLLYQLLGYHLVVHTRVDSLLLLARYILHLLVRCFSLYLFGSFLVHLFLDYLFAQLPCELLHKWMDYLRVYIFLQHIVNAITGGNFILQVLYGDTLNGNGLRLLIMIVNLLSIYTWLILV